MNLSKSTLNEIAEVVQKLRARGWSWEDISYESDNPEKDIFKYVHGHISLSFWPEELLIIHNWKSVVKYIKANGTQEDIYYLEVEKLEDKN